MTLLLSISIFNWIWYSIKVKFSEAYNKNIKNNNNKTNKKMLSNIVKNALVLVPVAMAASEGDSVKRLLRQSQD